MSAEHEAAAIAALKQHPAFILLRRRLARSRRRYFHNLARGLTHSNKPVDQRELDYKRGFYDGATWILLNPELAERELQKLIECRVRGDTEGSP